MKTLENEGPGYLENHRSVSRMVRFLDFEDGTNIITKVTSKSAQHEQHPETIPQQRISDVESSFMKPDDGIQSRYHDNSVTAMHAPEQCP